MKRKIRIPGKGVVEVTETVVDRVVAYLDPVRGAKRMASRTQMAVAGSGGYNGASRSRRGTSSWIPGSGSADSDILPDLPALRDRSRDLVRNAPLAGGAIATNVTKVVGTGLMCRPDIDQDAIGLTDDQADAWEERVQREWNLWALSTNCDITATSTFAALQDVAFRSTLESGDIFCLLPNRARVGHPYQLKVQMIEADRCCNKGNVADTDKLAGGVHLDEFGAPESYDFLTRHPGDVRASYKWLAPIMAFGTETGRRNVLHLFKKIRPGQTRGVPYLAAVIEPLKQLDRYTEAEIMAAVISGMFTVFVKSESGTGLADFAPTSETGSASSDDDYKLSSGAIIDLLPGESVESANPGRPNTAFDPFVMSILRQIGVGLELPFEVLIKHYTSSYTSARASIIDAWSMWMTRRQWMVDVFCQPVYETWLAEAVSNGRVSAPGFFNDPIIRAAYSGTKWIGPAKGQINERVEMAAAKDRIEMEISTTADEAAAINGSTWSKNHRQRTKEIKAMRENEPDDVPPVDGM